MASSGSSQDPLDASLRRKANDAFEQIFRIVSAVEANRHGPRQSSVSEGDLVFRQLDQLPEDDPVLRKIKEGTDSINARVKLLLSKPPPQDAGAQTELQGTVKLMVSTLDKGQQIERFEKDQGTQTLSTQQLDFTDPEILDQLTEDVGKLTQRFPREIMDAVMEEVGNTLEFIHLEYKDEPGYPEYDHWVECPNLTRVNAITRTCRYMRYFALGTDKIARTFDLEKLSTASIAFFRSLMPAYKVTGPFPKYAGLPERIRQLHNNLIIMGHQGESSVFFFLRGQSVHVSCNPSRSLLFMDGFVKKCYALRQPGENVADIPKDYADMGNRFPIVMLKIDEVFDALSHILKADETNLVAPVLGPNFTLDDLIGAWRRVLGPLMSWRSDVSLRILVGEYWPRVRTRGNEIDHTVPDQHLVRIKDPNAVPKPPNHLPTHTDRKRMFQTPF